MSAARLLVGKPVGAELTGTGRLRQPPAASSGHGRKGQLLEPAPCRPVGNPGGDDRLPPTVAPVAGALGLQPHDVALRQARHAPAVHASPGAQAWSCVPAPDGKLHMPLITASGLAPFGPRRPGPHSAGAAVQGLIPASPSPC